MRHSSTLLALMVALSVSSCMAQLDEEVEATEEAAPSLTTDEPEEAQARVSEPESGAIWNAAELGAKEPGAKEPAGALTNCIFGGPSGCGFAGGYCCGDLICCGPTQGCCMDHQGPYCSWDPCP